MKEEKMQGDAAYRIRADIPNYFYTVFRGAETGEIIIGETKSRLEMPAGGRKMVGNIEELLNILPKKEGDEIAVSAEQMSKYLQAKVTPEGGKELTFDAELGCNCGPCGKRCELKYNGKSEIVVLNIGGEERYFVGERLT